MLDWLMKKLFGTPTRHELEELRRKEVLLEERFMELQLRIARAQDHLHSIKHEEVRLLRERARALGSKRLKCVK